MWADILLRAEQQHAISLLLWGALTVLSATVIAVTLAVQNRASPLLAQFATQLAFWGLLAALVSGIEWHGLHVRDAAGAARVERLAWMRIGFDVGIVGMGITLAAAAGIIGRKLGAIGAGIAIVLHGLALFAIDVQFASGVSR